MASLLSAEDLPAAIEPRPVMALEADAERPSEAQFEHGRPHKVVDAIGWTFGIPKKIILWDRRACNHNVSLQTEQSLAEYMQANGLYSTKVRINQYDPVGEWQRLHSNDEVGAGWRYTVGVFSTLAYTVFPGRLFGSDRYNPYTDSIYVYSDIPCIVQEQGSYAKLVGSRRHPGTYAAVASLPVVRLWPQKQIKRDVIDYTLATGTPEQQREATRILYAEYGAQVGGQASLFVGSNLPFTLVGAGIGHVAARVRKSPSSDLPEVSDSPAPEWTAQQLSETSDSTIAR
jgi:hypothetical protein